MQETFKIGQNEINIIAMNDTPPVEAQMRGMRMNIRSRTRSVRALSKQRPGNLATHSSRVISHAAMFSTCETDHAKVHSRFRA